LTKAQSTKTAGVHSGVNDATAAPAPDDADALRVFNTAAELFAMLSTPVRLQILSSLCDEEKNVSQLLSEIQASQSNLSQHLGAMYRSAILNKRREGNQIFYSVRNRQAVLICRSVCNQIAIDS
jgi:DNA-binding transcriptional ArsR family regulator